jgi:hypothetical protein
VPRFDPTVTPISEIGSSSSTSDLPAPTQSRRGGQSSFYTSADYHEQYLSGALTPLDVAEVLLPLIRRDTTPPGKHSIAFLETSVDAVLAAARASTKRYQKGEPLGPLDGVPVAVKDEVLVKGYSRSLGSKLDFKKGIDETAWCVKKWEEAGAILMGKTNMHECGSGELSFRKPNRQFLSRFGGVVVYYDKRGGRHAQLALYTKLNAC